MILQDKASCLPAIALDPPPDAVVLDACSAPGNKTLHIAAIMANTGKIFAVEMNKKRFHRLKMNINHHGAKNVSCLHTDFLNIDYNIEPYCHVTHILLDPSCSGLGMVTQRVAPLHVPPERLASLARVQKTLLLRALSFPNVKRVVYSTCSVRKEENEEVVQEVLSTNPSWNLARILPNWERRGDTAVMDDAKKCIRCCPEDETNGFFLACFVKDSQIKQAEFQNIFSVHHILQRYKIKYHYKSPYKFFNRLC